MKNNYEGLVISDAKFENDEMRLTFQNGTTIRIFDAGQSCCEHRYMTCDDDVSSIIGDTLRIISTTEEQEIPKDEDGDDIYDDCHEIVFLEIKTNKSVLSFATHNEHNGYYGGFFLKIEEVTK